MSSEVLDMIKKDNVADLKDAINTDLHDRIKQSIELKKVEVAKDLASKPKPEEKQAVTEPVEEPEVA
tara:strand:+ start:228 stop:428 length:201 start_codon:yes stop_codon:yes gene_type:complete